MSSQHVAAVDRIRAPFKTAAVRLQIDLATHFAVTGLPALVILACVPA